MTINRTVTGRLGVKGKKGKGLGARGVERRGTNINL